jgi:hypothetical protein
MTFNTWMALLAVCAAADEGEPLGVDGSIDGRCRFALKSKNYVVFKNQKILPTERGLNATRDD